jgi:Protein of unknown function (DUF3822)
MLQPSFIIHKDGLENIETGNARLFIDAGQAHFAFAVLEMSANAFIAYEFYQLKPANLVEDLSWITSNNALLLSSYNDIFVSFNTKEAILIPEAFYKKEDGESILSMIHGDLYTGKVLQEHIPGNEIYSVYQVPDFLHTELSNRFSNGHYWHFYTALLQIFEERKSELPDSFIYINFYPSQVVIAVIQNGICQLIQTFLYDIPEDVSYHLLNITEQFDIDNAAVPVLVSGLIDTGSALYAELLKYYLKVETDSGSKRYSFDPCFETSPDHFFTPVFSLALCE